jgi:hypothetical protein
VTDRDPELQRLLDIEAIRTLVVRFVQLGDQNDHHGWIDECLHDDVEWAVRHIDDARVTAGVDVLHGKEAVREVVTTVGYRGIEPGLWHGSHIVSPPVVTVDGDTAHAVTDAVWLWHVPSDGPRGELTVGALTYDVPDYRIISVVQWRDELVRTPAGWRIKVHRPARLGTAPRRSP